MMPYKKYSRNEGDEKMIKSLNKEINVNELDIMMAELESKTEFACSAVTCTIDTGIFCGGNLCGGNFHSCSIKF